MKKARDLFLAFFFMEGLTHLNEFLGLKEFLEMSHLPGTHNKENCCLSQRPPQDTLVGAFTCLTEAFFTYLNTITITIISNFKFKLT